MRLLDLIGFCHCYPEPLLIGLLDLTQNIAGVFHYYIIERPLNDREFIVLGFDLAELEFELGEQREGRLLSLLNLSRWLRLWLLLWRFLYELKLSRLSTRRIVDLSVEAIVEADTEVSGAERARRIWRFSFRLFCFPLLRLGGLFVQDKLPFFRLHREEVVPGKNFLLRLFDFFVDLGEAFVRDFEDMLWALHIECRVVDGLEARRGRHTHLG